MPDLTYSTIEEYIAQAPRVKQERLRELWRLIRENAPEASEKISWAMPTFYQNGNLIHFSASTKHIGIYPGAEAVEHFVPRLEEEGYVYSKGAIQLPDNRPLPLDLVRDIVLFRVQASSK